MVNGERKHLLFDRSLPEIYRNSVMFQQFVGVKRVLVQHSTASNLSVGGIVTRPENNMHMMDAILSAKRTICTLESQNESCGTDNGKRTHWTQNFRRNPDSKGGTL